MTGLQLPGGNSLGVLLFNDAGNVNFNNLSVLSSAGRGIDIEGGSGQLQFAGTTTVAGASAESVNIQNLLSTGTVTFDNLSINHRQGPGLAINQSSGTVSVTGTTTINNEIGSNASAISISNSSGNTTFGGAVNVSNSVTAPGVSLQSNTGTTTFSSLNVTSVNGTGLFSNLGGTLVINSAATPGIGGIINSANGTAVDIENTNMNVNLASVSSSNAPVGIKLIASPGTFLVTGDAKNDVGTGGTIQNDTVGVVLQNTGTVGLLGMNLTSNGVGIQADNVKNLGIATTTVSGSTSFGVDALDVATLTVNGATLTGNGAANIRSQYDAPGVYTIDLGSSTLTSTTADNLLISATFRQRRLHADAAGPDDLVLQQPGQHGRHQLELERQPDGTDHRQLVRGDGRIQHGRVDQQHVDGLSVNNHDPEQPVCCQWRERRRISPDYGRPFVHHAGKQRGAIRRRPRNGD